MGISLAVLVLFGVVLKLAFPWIEDHQTYKPLSEFESVPAQNEMPHRVIDFISASGFRVYGWIFSRPGATRTLVFFHGNAGNISHNLHFVKLFQSLTPLNFVLVDYRGYGKNGGTARTEGVLDDLDETVRKIRGEPGWEHQKFIFFGRSLGGVLAIETAARVPCDGLIVENAFLSIREMAKIRYPRFPLFWFTTDRLDAGERIKRVTCPVLIVHCTLDEVIPYGQGGGVRLFESANAPKRFLALEGADHNNAVEAGGDKYLRELKGFIEGI